ncbi:MAG: NADH:flavin oxidoreductase [Erysipelotrichaceae bacterium]|nr:NADH:flavin oxidoreductase [Erysipelotrichaceae bacterium]
MSLIKTPLKINNLTLNNRLVMPPMATSKSDDGKVSESILEYYDRRAQGGYIGLIITEHSFISRKGQASENQVSVSEDEDIEGLRNLAETIKKDGTKAFVQINHAGLATCNDIVYGPSETILPSGKNKDKTTIAMSKEEIGEVVDDFASAALRVKKAGFDGVEIHCAHGYLLNQFYSPLTNKRTDEYGGSLENRIRIVLEVIQAVREKVGPDFPVAVRLGACDYCETGSTIEDGVFAAKEFEKAGVNILDISGGFNGFTSKDDSVPGYFKDASHPIKEAVEVPVILTGGVTDINDAEDLLQKEDADLIGVGRALFNDCDWAKNSLPEIE